MLPQIKSLLHEAGLTLTVEDPEVLMRLTQAIILRVTRKAE